jgi:hypothetical protein
MIKNYHPGFLVENVVCHPEEPLGDVGIQFYTFNIAVMYWSATSFRPSQRRVTICPDRV